jgi:hypothetical protein
MGSVVVLCVGNHWCYSGECADSHHLSTDRSSWNKSITQSAPYSGSLIVRTVSFHEVLVVAWNFKSSKRGCSRLLIIVDLESLLNVIVRGLSAFTSGATSLPSSTVLSDHLHWQMLTKRHEATQMIE